jgi:hypothetical protein
VTDVPLPAKGSTDWYSWAQDVEDATDQTHAATAAATANMLVKRDAAGRAQVADGSAAADLVTKGQLDQKANTAHTHGVTDLTATGTRDGTTVLHGDNTWKVASGGGTQVSVDAVDVATLAIDSASITAADLGITAPAIIAPPACLFTTAGAAAWPNANNGIFHRFSVPAQRSYRYINVGITTASGNFEAAVVRLSGAGHLSFTKIAGTGLLAATAGDQRLDLTAFDLTAGDYALVMWADNTTIQMRVLTNSGVATSRLTSEHGPMSTGIPTTGTLGSWGGARAVTGLSLEASI